MTKKIISWILVLAVIGFAVFALSNSKNDTPKKTADDLPKILSTAVYMDEAGYTIPVLYYEDAVVFTTKETGDLVLPLAISASGARYTNEDESVVFWNKGDAITITYKGEEIFSGATYDSSEIDGEGKSVVDPIKVSSSLTDSPWNWVSTGLSTNDTIAPKKAGSFSLTFTKDGKVSGTTDCNSFGGTYTTDKENKISFGELASTQMFCEGSQESAFIDMISKTDRYTFTNEGNLVLLLMQDAGSVMFRKK